MAVTALPGARRPRALSWGLVIGLAGILLSGIGFFADPRQAYASWLAALTCGLSLGVGALILVAVTHITGARWFDPLRRLALDIIATLPLLAIFFMVLVPGLGWLYPWVHTQGPEDRGNVAWLNVPFFLERAALYFAIWITVGLLLRHWAIARGQAATRPPALRERALAAVTLPALGLSLTFGAFDWIMSLAPSWASTAFGVYWFAGGFLAALALLGLVAALHRDHAGAKTLLGPSQATALGTLMLTFVVFWAYIAYCQYFIIWIGDIPAEAAWYIPRVRGSWGLVALVVLLGQFFFPMLALLFHSAKRNAHLLAVVAAWLLLMHYADTYWLVLPALHPDGVHPHWLDLSAIAAVAGSGSAWTAWLHRR